MTLRIRLATLSDLDGLLALEQEAFAPQLYHRICRRQFRYLLTKAQAEIWLVEAQDQPLGASILFFRRGAAYARLYSLAVRTSAQGQGIGSRLLQHAETRFAELGLREIRQEVRFDNQTLIQRYSKAGYRPYGRSEAYYPDGQACLKLKKALRHE